MYENKEKLNRFLVDVFNEITKTEEKCIAKGRYNNLTIRELHVIEAICICNEQGKNTVTSISAFLGIVPGTLTVSLNSLGKKGYIQRIKDETDKRVVRVIATCEGEKANAAHKRFHEQMVDDVFATLTHEEMQVLIKGLGSISSFFREKTNKEE